MDRNEKSILTIVIPTYNRCQILNNSLEILKDLSHRFCFNLIVCNNASTDDTSNILQKWEKLIPNMEVINHEQNVYFDRNVASGYMRVKTDYCWVLGDSYSIQEDNFGKLLYVLKEDAPDALIINRRRYPVKMEDKIYDDRNILLRELGWYTTLLPSCIINRKFIELNRINKYLDSAFVHEGLLYDYLSSLSPINVLFSSSILIETIDDVSRATSSWRKTPFKVFGEGWFAFVMSLPYNYDINSKLYCISQHDRKTKIFSFDKILFLRLIGCMKFDDYKQAKPIMKFVTKTPLIAFDLISIIPSMPRLSKVIIEFLYRYHIIKRKWVEMVNYTNY